MERGEGIEEYRGSDKGRENEKGSERGMDIVKRIVKK